MTPDRWARIKSVFAEAQQRSGDERQAFLDQTCGADAELRQEVESLLQERAEVTNLERPAEQQDWIGRTISHYRIVEKLGGGGMGVVFRAEDTKLRRSVALKFLPPWAANDPATQSRFLKEAEAAAALDHLNITTVYEVGEDDGQSFIAMAFVDGQTLTEKISERPLPLAEALEIASQVAGALQAAHERGVVHRDIKPGNIMLTAKGAVKVMDFGLAHLSGQTRITRTGTIMGTPAYMSPEQTRGEEADYRSDIWALGVVLYEMVSGRLPFRGENAQTTALTIQNEEPEPLTGLRTDIPVEIDWTLGKTLAKTPDERYQHAEDLLIDLRALRSSSAIGVKSTVSPGKRGQRRSDWQKARLGALVFIVLVVLAWAYYGSLGETGIERTVRRFTVAPEASGAAVYSRAHSIGLPAAATISPDGSRVAYWSAETPARLWLHDLSSGESSPVEGTEYVTTRAHPGGLTARLFWSPDGDSVGFVMASELKRVNLRDGSVASLHALDEMADSYCGAAWSPDGRTIVFCAGSAGGARWFTIPASGGSAKQVLVNFFVEPDSRAGNQTRVGNPTFVPSRFPAVIFESRGLFLLHLPSGETSLLLENARSPNWSPTGHVIFDREGSVWALPFSASGLEPTGEAFLVEPGFANGGVSADGTLLSVTSEVFGDRYQLTIRDRQGTLLGNIGPTLIDAHHTSVSPDGKKVAVAASRQVGVASDIWVFSIEGREGIRLTTHPGNDTHPAWARDGQRILYRVGGGTGRTTNLVMASAVGGGRVEAFFESDRRIAESAFSPDGKYLIFQDRDPEGTQFDIRYLENPKPGDQREPVAWLGSKYNEGHPQFSPDGQYVAYASRESGTGAQVHIRPFPEGSPVWQVSVEGGNAPRWSADGRELYWWGKAAGFPIMAATIDFARASPVGEPEALFPTGRGVYT